VTRAQVYLYALALAGACISSIAATIWLFDAERPWWGAFVVAPAAAIWLRTMTMRAW